MSAEEYDEDDFELEVGGCVSVPGSSAITAPITSKELISEVSWRSFGCRNIAEGWVSQTGLPILRR